jgi:hypothetical protein
MTRSNVSSEILEPGAERVPIGPILLQKSFFAADQNFSGQLTRFLSKYVRDLIPW